MGPVSMKDMTFMDVSFEPWPEITGRFKVPKYKDLRSIDMRATTEKVWLERNGTTREAICEKIKTLLSQNDVRYFNSALENFELHVDLANRHADRLRYSWDPVGVMITKRHELIVWELYYSEYLFLQDSDGRMCYLSPKKR